MPQSQAAAHPRHKEEEETDKTKQAQIEQMYEKHQKQVFIEKLEYYYTGTSL